MTSSTIDAIRYRAYEIWQEEGQPHGRDREHWEQAARELGAGPSDLERNPGISSTGGGDPEDIEGDNTTEGDVMNDTTPSGGIDPDQRGRTNA